MDRERFLKETGRWTILAVLTGLILFLVRNRNISDSYSCAENKFCKNCSKFKSCSLPQAIEQS